MELHVSAHVNIPTLSVSIPQTGHIAFHLFAKSEWAIISLFSIPLQQCVLACTPELLQQQLLFFVIDVFVCACVI